MYNMLSVEEFNIIAAIMPVGMEGGANNGDWVSMKNYSRCSIVILKAAGTGGENPAITIQQADDATGANNVALNFTRVDYKRGGQTAIGTFAQTVLAAANTYVDASSGASQGLFVIDIFDNMLSSGKSFIQVSIPDTGTAAQLGCALYIMSNPRYRGVPLLSAIA